MKTEKAVFYSILIYCLIFPLWPFYLDFRIGDSLAINPQRVINIIIFSLFSAHLILKPGGCLAAIFEFNGRAIRYIFAYFSIGFISALYNQERAILFWVNEFFSNLLIFIAAISCIKSRKEISLLMKALSIGGFFCAIYSFFEFALQNNYFVSMANTDTAAGFAASLDKTRDGVYRTQGTFEHPLALVQFLIASIFSSAYLYSIGENRVFNLFSFVAMSFAVFMTGSRTALAAPLVSIIFCVFIIISAKIYSGRIGYLGAVGSIAFVILLPLIGFYMFGLVTGDGSAAHSSSSITRINQIYNGVMAVTQKPLLGHGFGNGVKAIVDVGDMSSNAAVIYNESVDNSFLTKAVEVGLIGLFLYCAFFVLSIKKAAFELFDSVKSKAFDSGYLIVFCLCLSLIMTFFVISIFTIHPIVFLCFAILHILNASRESQRSENFKS